MATYEFGDVVHHADGICAQSIDITTTTTQQYMTITRYGWDDGVINTMSYTNDVDAEQENPMNFVVYFDPATKGIRIQLVDVNNACFGVYKDNPDPQPVAPVEPGTV